jgi:predicted DCC family thiol-disulfide oxidoreductase YuxK
VYSNRGVLPDASASPLARLFPNVLGFCDPPWFATALLIAAALLAVQFAVGWRDRFAAVALWYLWACFFGRNPLTSNPGLPYVGLMLLAHALIPPAPYGSLDARGRTDPAGGWFMPRRVWAAVWILMAVGYTYSGLTKLPSPSWVDGSALRHVLENPLARPTALRETMLALPEGVLRAMTWGALALEVAFAPLALVRRLRPWVWLAGLAMHLGLMTLIDFADLSLGMVMLHAFTFNPAWVRPKPAAATAGPAAGGGATIFYDGHCGLCHGFVRFVLAEDRPGAFRFAPLQGETFASAYDGAARHALPDSVVVRAADGGTLVRSAAALRVLEGLGGAWRAQAIALRIVPRPLRDRAYDGLARIRKRLAGWPDQACPILPPALRARFDR